MTNATEQNSLLASSPPSLVFTFNKEIQARIRKIYGDEGLERTIRWSDKITDLVNDEDWRQLNLANHFVNHNVEYARDLALWAKNDYWATPLETIGVGHGDCEDYAIAKYFTLVAGGVAAEKLRLMYVYHMTVKEPHMVLIYFEKPRSMPLVLDNYTKRIQPANLRTDLKPVYSFNADGLWLAKARSLGNKVKEGSGVAAWDNLMERIERQEMQPNARAN